MKNSFSVYLLIFSITWLITGCTKNDEKPATTLFTTISSSESGITFANNLEFDMAFNIYTYRNYYNGGGVALGDINNDGLVDVYLTGNLVPNKLYLNKGNFKFEDITTKAGVEGKGAWSTGVAMADVNGDGLIDIYLCNSGDIKGDKKQNELFINNGNLTFTEKASEYGVADRGYTTHAAFFDYDKDGDLDLYVLNNSYQPIGSFNLRKNARPVRDSLGGHKLMRNDGAVFTDVSEEAGIYGSVIAFGLGVTVGDLNKDGWPDIYVSNDFFERDYLYINNHDGTFKESLTKQMRSISGTSMGADVADINNDGYPDVFVTEMLPHENSRLKTVTTFENWDRYQFAVQNDYYHQFTRNTLQLNNGDGTYSEIGRLAGVEATDWSWGALMFDMDNDGLKDIFVSNGIFQDLTDQDYLQYVSNPEIVRTFLSGNGVNYQKLIESIPSTPIPDFAFHNEGNLKFTNKAKEWGLGKPNFSNGAAYGDLDNDGDLDLIVNNVNEECAVYRNESNNQLRENRYLKFELKGVGKNTFAFGSSITITAKGTTFYQEQMPIRGFESSMDPRINFGLGKLDTVDQITVRWPGGKQTLMKNVATNQTIRLEETQASEIKPSEATEKPTIIFKAVPDIVEFTQKENDFVDFDRDHLLFHMQSTEGPRMSKGDVNGDGREDFYIGGAKDEPGALFIQTSKGEFIRSNEKLFEAEKAPEDAGSVMFDADGDADLDLYVCSGGTEYSNSSLALVDRFFINDGKGNFSRSTQLLPTTKLESKSTVKVADYDLDGDLDIFVGSRSLSFYYGVAMNGYILKNDGKGNFENVTKKIAPALENIGMITDAEWVDIDGDKDPDLMIVGDYMPIKVFVNEKGNFVDQTAAFGLDKTSGWWNRIEAGDVDNDGDIDFVIGNLGLNSRFRASVEKPITMYVNDFDQNGTVEQVICVFNGDKSYPMPLRHDLVSQIPSLKKKYLKYENYKDQTITDIFTPEQLKNAAVLTVTELASCVLLNDNGKFILKPLPIEAQLTPVFGIEIEDFDNDGNADILLGGNLYRVKPEVGRYDASYGVTMRGDGSGNFKAVAPKDAGMMLDGEVRDIMTIKTTGGDVILVARNSDTLLTFKKIKK